jgi:Arc/MetJ-type ribon-helix-helix transcriptional regulator
MGIYHTNRGLPIATAKGAVSIDEQLLREVDRWVAEGAFASRSRAVQTALALLKERRTDQAFLEDLAKLDPAEERALADEFLTGETAWPEYQAARSSGLISIRYGDTRRVASGRW